MLTAGDIVAFAERRGFKLRQMGCAKPTDPQDHCCCPRRTLANEVTESESMYRPEVIAAVQERFGLTGDDQEALEVGFEGWDYPEHKGNKYYKLGKKIFKLVSQRE